MMCGAELADEEAEALHLESPVFHARGEAAAERMPMKKTFWIAIALCACCGCSPDGSTNPPAMSLTAPVERATWETPYGNGAVLSSAHYRIYATAQRGDIQNTLPRFMEAAYQTYRSTTGLPDLDNPQPLNIYMMGTRAEWMELTAMTVQENQEIYLSIEAGGYCYKGVCVFWDIGGLSTYAVAAHEGLHQFFWAQLKNHLPMWLEEGLCASMEGFDLQRTSVAFTPRKNSLRMDNLRSVLNSQSWIELPTLLSMDAGDAVSLSHPESAVAYYAQLWALAQFIQSQPQYRAGMVRMIADARQGVLNQGIQLTPEEFKQCADGRQYNKLLSEPLFHKYISTDLEGFAKEYRAFSRKLAGL